MKPLWDALPERFPRKTTFIVRNQKGVFSLGSSVLIFDGLSSSTYFSIDGGISDLAVSPEWTKFRLLFGPQRGVLFRSDDENRVFATEFENPRVEFLPDGQFVAVDRQQCAVFDRSLNEVASYAWTIPNDPVAVVSAVRAGVFAVVFADGLVRVMKVE